ncbi:hypothetical protein PV396_33285 [Streptomyces sp. ME02-8801-2C]|uniref:hypothetical protein n=1 Tax=Streptomyces sp. ME02-8801-2C TaxID=3028680 RepID=UPI0029A44440|nr:hypothetical protein [Streptomyces sp. ME02-8801-2C]MDX3456770.1 hypothetical protein [Streptomyces sp. ME02-8801-2C]
MTQAPALGHERDPGARMTIRVYTVRGGSGEIVEDRGVVRVLVSDDPPPLRIAFPPCACPLHRRQEAAQ